MIIGLSLGAAALLFLWSRHGLDGMWGSVTDLYGRLLRQICGSGSRKETKRPPPPPRAAPDRQLTSGPSTQPVRDRTGSDRKGNGYDDGYSDGDSDTTVTDGDHGALETGERIGSSGAPAFVLSPPPAAPTPAIIEPVETTKATATATATRATATAAAAATTIESASARQRRPASQTMPPPPFLVGPAGLSSSLSPSPPSSSRRAAPPVVSSAAPAARPANLPIFPAMNSQQRASGPARTTATGGGLSVPASGPAQARRSPAAASKAVALKPGFSTMDWASAKARAGFGLGPGTGSAGPRGVSAAELRAHNGRRGRRLWSSYQGFVYDVSEYVDYHPGGPEVLVRIGGRDGERLFMENHPWVSWENMLDACLIGPLVPDVPVEAGLDEMD